MDQHRGERAVFGPCGEAKGFQSGFHRFLTGLPARDRRQKPCLGGMVKLVDAGLVKCQIIGMDDALHRPDPRIRQHGVERMHQNRNARQQTVLLWQTFAGPMSAPCSDKNKRH